MLVSNVWYKFITSSFKRWVILTIKHEIIIHTMSVFPKCMLNNILEPKIDCGNNKIP